MYVSANEKAVSLKLHRYIKGPRGKGKAEEGSSKVGRYTLTPPDP
jgi:hypothetical protein